MTVCLSEDGPKTLTLSQTPMQTPQSLRVAGWVNDWL